MPSPSYVPVIRTGVDVSFNNVTVSGVLTTTGAVVLNGGGAWAGLMDAAGSLATSSVFGTLVTGDTIDRLRVRADGRHDWGPGLNGARDTNLYRSGVGVLSTDTNLRVGGNLGVGNSAAATTLGAVTKKVEIFDPSGVSLGFIPVYNSIT